MTEAIFQAKRRQKFLTEKYFKLNNQDLKLDNAEALKTIPRRRAEGKYDAVMEGGIFKDNLKILKLHYTAGEPIEFLIPLYDAVIEWFDKWTIAYRDQIASLAAESGDDLRTDGSPAYFEDLFHFQLVIDVVSLGILLGEGEAVRKVAEWVGRYRGTDMLFEALVEPAVTDPRDVDEFFHEKPYDPLLDAIYTVKIPEERSAKIQQYLNGWYKAFDGLPWHDGHVSPGEEYSNYVGYWSFESAAVCLIYNIDDSSFRDHLLYPKDLADWARENGSLDKIKPGAVGVYSPQKGRVESNNPCPRSGWWMTPAKAGSRRYFEQGAIMPSFGSDYGLTIWQWDVDQSTPKL